MSSGTAALTKAMALLPQQERLQKELELELSETETQQQISTLDFSLKGKKIVNTKMNPNLIKLWNYRDHLYQRLKGLEGGGSEPNEEMSSAGGSTDSSTGSASTTGSAGSAGSVVKKRNTVENIGYVSGKLQDTLDSLLVMVEKFKTGIGELYKKSLPDNAPFYAMGAEGGGERMPISK
jgi:hypothetical protein